jgi:HK97 family phage prohead protease
MTLRGHAATFGDVYDLGPFDERFAAGAFDDVLTDDVRALWNHDANTVLGRTKSGTLRLSVDERGLMTEIDLPESAMALREAIARGDVDQMSHGFTVEKDTWETTDKETGRELRTIEKVGTLYDVSPVTFPANPNTDVALRSLGLAKDDRTPVEEVLETEDESNTLSLVEAKRLLDLKKD